MHRPVPSPAPDFRRRAARRWPAAAALAALFATAAGLPARGAALAAEPAAAPAATATRAAGTFDQLKALQGTWKGANGKGHEETSTFRLIAGGRVLQQDILASDDPTGKNRMNVSFQLDGDRLLATHYCAFGSTPRLAATAVDDAAHTITFTYVDAVNLPSRDKGHMDKMVLHLVDADHFTTHWTWYENGKESWLDEIKYQRTH